MTNSSGSRSHRSTRLVLPIVFVVVIGLLGFVVWLFIGLGGYTWRSEVSVLNAELRSPDRLALIVGTCQKDPEVTLLRETDVDVQVKVVASSHPFLRGGLDCQDIIEAQLQTPLRNRIVIDNHTQRVVKVRAVVPYTVADTEPGSNWGVVEVGNLPSQTAFSLLLPPEWELNELQGIDSFLGEVTGDGVRLTIDYGRFSKILDLADDPEHTYAVGYEDIGGFQAKLLISMVPGAGYTGAYFDNLAGFSLSLWGEDLTTEQQKTAVAVFRSVKLLGQQE